MYFIDASYNCIYFLQLNEHQISKIKKGEELSVEREKEIQQASAYTSSMFLVVCCSPMFFFFLVQSIIIFFLLLVLSLSRL